MTYNKILSLTFFSVITLVFSESLRNTSNNNHNIILIEDDHICIQKSINITKSFNCIGNESCSYHGTCINSTMCHCNNNYVTHNPTTNVQCNYNQKNRLVAFLLELFLFGGGAGEWYLENTKYAIGNIVYFFGGMLVVLCMTCIGACTFNNKKSVNAFSSFFATLWLSGWVIYLLYELIMIGSGQRIDGNGVKIGSW